MIVSEDGIVGIIDPEEIGIIKAHLLAQGDTSAHNKMRCVLNGPEEITWKQIVDMVKQQIGSAVKQMIYKDIFLIDMLYEPKHAVIKKSKNVIYSIIHALEASWKSKCSNSTNKKILDLFVLKQTHADILKTLLK